MTVPVVQLVNGLRNARFTLWVWGSIDLREYHCSMLTFEQHVLPAQRLKCRELWPSRSPYLNPIELLWEVLEQCVKGHPTASTNLTELWTALANI
ncbi:hypothetical protein TNCV_2264451 [Trichonephila clavipes]|nr:hypothetical protein TNCV_2264451 [Trichonephila clavipes]